MQKIFAAVLVLGIVAAPYGPWIPFPDCGDADRLQPLGVSGRSGLNASVSRDSLAFTWDGERNQELGSDSSSTTRVDHRGAGRAQEGEHLGSTGDERDARVSTQALGEDIYGFQS
jgi:hypothetical protein